MKVTLQLWAVLVVLLFSYNSYSQTSNIEFQSIQASQTILDEGDPNQITYKIKNLGPNAATNIIVNDLLPPGLSYVSDDGGGEYNSGTNIWSIPNLNSGATNNLKIDVTAAAGTSGTTVTITSVISGLDQTDPDSSNNTFTLDLTILPLDLELKKKVDDNTPEVGQIIEYELEIKHRNTTTISATNVLVEDILSSNLTYISDDSGGNYDPITGIWTVGTLIPNQSKKIVIQAQVNQGTSGTSINNVARVLSFDQIDQNPVNDEAAVEVEVLTSDLVLIKTVDDSSPDEGDTITYNLYLGNLGPSTARSVLIYDLLPPGVTYVSDDSGGNYNPVTGIWNVGNINSGANTNIDIDVTVDANTAAQTISNESNVYSFEQLDDNRADNNSFVDINVNGADLEVVKTVSDQNPAVNDVITYTIIVTNHGPLKANNITLRDLLDPDLIYSSSTITQGNPYNSGTGNWFIDDLNNGTSATLTINAQVSPTALNKLVPNTASILSVVEDDSFVSNNSDTVNIGVGNADLEVIKNVSQATINSGDSFTYTIQVINNSLTTDAFGTTVTDLLPAEISYVSDDSGGNYDPASGIWDVGTVLSNSSQTLTITCTVDANTGGLFITNTAAASSIMEDLDLSNNSDDATLQVNGADLEVSITVSNSNPIELDVISYTVTVTNNGPDEATGIQIDDSLPFGVAYTSDTPSQGTYDYLTGIWDVGSITNGNSATLVINTEVRLPGSTKNEVFIIAADQSDGFLDNNSDDVDVYASKTFSPGSAIIDMGVTPQTYNNGLIPYGLIYDLSINNKIAVYWAVNNNKSWVNPSAKQDQIDMNVDGKDYKGGPFIIPEDFMVFAQPIIDSWVTNYPGLTVDIAASSFVAPVYDVVTSFPRAVLDSQNGDKVQSAFYEQAMVPLTFGRIGTPDDLTSCDDMYTMPHADPQNWSTSTVNNLVDFIQQGGYFWAACHAVSAMEGAVDTDNDGNPELNLLSNEGLILWGDHDDGNPPYDYNPVEGIFNGAETAGDPLMQFMATADGAWQNGSEQIYIPETGGWRNTTVLAITDEDHPEVTDGTYPPGPAAAVAYGPAFGDKNNGMIMYEASHSIAGGTEQENVASARIYGNFLLQAGIERRPQIEMATIPIQITVGDSFLAVVGVTGIAPPFTYEWTDTCGGTFDNPLNTSANYFPNPNIVDQERCYITFNVTDNCGRSNFRSFSVLVDKDTDQDGIINVLDLDDDNDGIPDTVENNGDSTRDSDNDGIYDRLDLDADGDGILDIVEGGLTTAQIATFDTDYDGFIDPSFSFGANGLIDDLETAPESGTINYAIVNSDSDSNYNFQDIDADNDGIPDNIELQPTIGYVAPDATVTEFGINTAYDVVGGMTLTYSDLGPSPDYLDTDADEDGIPDIEENGMADAINTIDTDGDGLDDAFEGVTVNDPFDVNDDINDPATSVLPDNDNNLGSWWRFGL